MGDPRLDRGGGQSGECAESCVRRSGETLRITQRSPSPLTATDDWVRPAPRLRASAQFGQAQFHCGTPPPAAEPRMMIRIEQRGRVGHPAPPLTCNALVQALPAYAPTSIPSSTTANSGLVQVILPFLRGLQWSTTTSAQALLAHGMCQWTEPLPERCKAHRNIYLRRRESLWVHRRSG